MEQLSLFNIDFPVFGITNKYKKIWEEHNVLYIETETGIYVLDNKNMDGNTLGERRLKINTSKLYRPKKIYYTLAQMIHSKYTIYIDKFGKLFNYKKSKFVPLEYYKVDSITNANDGECVLNINRINYSYKINCRKAYSINYIGLLKTEFGLIPYEFSDIWKPATKRKI